MVPAFFVPVLRTFVFVILPKPSQKKPDLFRQISTERGPPYAASSTGRRLPSRSTASTSAIAATVTAAPMTMPGR